MSSENIYDFWIDGEYTGRWRVDDYKTDQRTGIEYITEGLLVPFPHSGIWYKYVPNGLDFLGNTVCVGDKIAHISTAPGHRLLQVSEVAKVTPKGFAVYEPSELKGDRYFTTWRSREMCILAGREKEIH